jgi:hypothetical protein
MEVSGSTSGSSTFNPGKEVSLSIGQDKGKNKYP